MKKQKSKREREKESDKKKAKESKRKKERKRRKAKERKKERKRNPRGCLRMLMHFHVWCQTDHLYFHRPSPSPSTKDPHDPSITSLVCVHKSVNGVTEAESQNECVSFYPSHILQRGCVAGEGCRSN